MKRVLAVLLVARIAHADVTAAARAFAEAQAAQVAGDYERAAQNYELAYSIAPSKEALRSAVRTRQLGGDLARAASLSEILLAKYGDDPASVKLATDVIAEARPKLGRIAVHCPTGCTIAVDGKAISLAREEHHAFYVPSGALTVVAEFEPNVAAKQDLSIALGESQELTLARPPRAVAPPPLALTPPPGGAAEPESHGWKPTVFYLGVGITLLATGVAIASGIQTTNLHDEYVANPTDEVFDEGRSLQRRTNILFGVAAGCAVVTAAIGIFHTEWHPPRMYVIAPSRGGATLAVTGRF